MVFERAAMRDSQQTGVHHVPAIEVSEYMQVTLSGVVAVHRCQVLCFECVTHRLDCVVLQRLHELFWVACLWACVGA